MKGEQGLWLRWSHSKRYTLTHLFLGDRLKTYFIDSGLMTEGEPGHIASLFSDLGINVEVINAQNQFFNALKGKVNPEEKR